MVKISIVTTLYNSSDYIEEFYNRITKEVKKITDDYEIIFVDDGSPDDSLQKATDIYEKDKKVKVIELSRNFGHHKAIMTGLSYAKGEFIFLIDSDLEEEPELLGKFWEEMQNQKDIDVVYGVQKKRKGGWFERLSGEIFYWLMNNFGDVQIPRNIMTCRLFTQAYNQALISHREREMIIAGLFVITGFKQKPVYVNKLSRSKTTYTLNRKISLFVNAITSFSTFPLKFIFYSGFFISLLSFIYILWLIYRKMFLGINLVGWTSLIVSIWFLGGMILFSLGIIGIYISKIFIETKKRPYTIIRKIYQWKSKSQ